MVVVSFIDGLHEEFERRFFESDQQYLAQVARGEKKEEKKVA